MCGKGQGNFLLWFDCIVVHTGKHFNLYPFIAPGRFQLSTAISMLRNHKKMQMHFIFPEINSAQQGLRQSVSLFIEAPKSRLMCSVAGPSRGRQDPCPVHYVWGNQGGLLAWIPSKETIATIKRQRGLRRILGVRRKAGQGREKASRKAGCNTLDPWQISSQAILTLDHCRADFFWGKYEKEYSFATSISFKIWDGTGWNLDSWTKIITVTS